MVECTLPEFHVKVCPQEEQDTCCVSTHATSLFNDRAIVLQSVSTSVMCGLLTLLGKQVAHFRMIRKFTPLIKMHAFVVTMQIALSEEVGKTFKRWPSF